jgi:hypothetical protein
MPTPEDFRRYREVVDAVEQAWSGDGSVEARARLVQELEAREIPLPPDPLLDIEADRIAGGHGGQGRSRGIFHQFRLMAYCLAEIRKLFHNATPLPHPPGRGTYLVENVPQAEVLLHPGAGELLAGLPGAPAAGLVGVWLGNTGAGISVNTQGGQVGVLRNEDVVAYRPMMGLAHDNGAVPVMLAVLSTGPDGALRLRLGVSAR